MLLIIVLGLIANLTLVFSDCVIENHVKNFDFTKFSGPRPWHWRWHNHSDFGKYFECPVSVYEPPEGNMSLVTVDAYDISAQIPTMLYGNTTNWKPAGWDEIYQEPSSLSGRAYVIAVDYDYYIIVKYCLFESDELYVYVGFRSQIPDKETEKRVMEYLKENNIDINQLVEWKVDNCQ